MPPKPRPIQKPSAAPKDAKPIPMPPPPPPAGILELEANALAGCLKNAAVNTAQVYQFYADARRLGIQKYAPNPPRSLTTSLGRQIEKYDQLCDAIESRLLRAIAVLKRDIGREEQRLKDIAAAAAPIAPPNALMPPPDAVPGTDTVDASGKPLSRTQTSPTLSEHGGRSSARRSSAISLSSLHRPPFPHKLDLSATALRMSVDEASMFTSGLASPVALAPKSSRPGTASNELPDLMAAFGAGTNGSVDIDLTVPDTDPPQGINIDLGGSADKPIELDLDNMDIDMSQMTDLFGDTAPDGGSNDAGAGLFSPPDNASDANKPTKTEDIDLEILDVLSGGRDDIFAFGVSHQDSAQKEIAPSNPHPPSPNSILASLDASSNQATTNAPFDIGSLDFSFFDNAHGTEEMERLLNMGGEEDKDPH